MSTNPKATLEIENAIWRSGFRLIAGTDEAGRGCLAGPVVAAAVILPRDLKIDGVADSKTMNAKTRARMETIIRNHATAIGIGVCSPTEIDRLNILWASMEAMKRAVSALLPEPDYILIDGNRSFPGCQWPHQCVVQGDARSHTIAAASIIAKTYRDRLMVSLDAQSPAYCWASNKGYPTKAHYRALADHGLSQHHRRSFRLQ